MDPAEELAPELFLEEPREEGSLKDIVVSIVVVLVVVKMASHKEQSRGYR